ncbi:MAG TPA: hypothetical protein VM406_14140 [Noviherbaspirillum sp.]|nr:hypothetical protein [Noviherbaspirillum sp.]
MNEESVKHPFIPNTPAAARVGPVLPLLPQFGRQDAAAVLISEWRVDSAARQRATLGAISVTWNARPWPAGLHDYAVFPSVDGRTLLHYSQWTDGAAFDGFVQHQRDTRVDQIDAAVPGIERYGLGRFRFYRSHVESAAGAATGCLVAVRVEADSAERQRAWIDTVIEALASARIPGLIAAHFHVCDDGRIVNLAQWESEDAHIRAVEGNGGMAQREGSAWQRVRTMPGVTQKGVQRFHLPLLVGRTLAAERAANDSQGGKHD